MFSSFAFCDIVQYVATLRHLAINMICMVALLVRTVCSELNTVVHKRLCVYVCVASGILLYTSNCVCMCVLQVEYSCTQVIVCVCVYGLCLSLHPN